MLMKSEYHLAMCYSVFLPKLKKEIKHLAKVWYDIANIADKRR